MNSNFIIFILLLNILSSAYSTSEEDEGVKYADRCEVCKVLALELEERLKETGKTHDVIETGYSLDEKQKRKKPYQKSELRLIESLEGVCDRILEYNIHKERTDSTRFAKGMSQTFKTLHGLVDKGVKVELGIPYELWDNPSAEITNMKMQCESVLENNEGDIEDWYWKYQEIKSLKDHLCRDNFLKNYDASCLEEKSKGDNGKNNQNDIKTEFLLNFGREVKKCRYLFYMLFTRCSFYPPGKGIIVITFLLILAYTMQFHILYNYYKKYTELQAVNDYINELTEKMNSVEKIVVKTSVTLQKLEELVKNDMNHTRKLIRLS